MPIEAIKVLLDILVAVVLQVLLFVVHRSGDSGANNAYGKSSGAEVTVGITIFWACYIGIGQLFRCIWAGFGVTLNVGLILDGVVSLFSKVVFTWCLHLLLVFFIDTLIPFVHELRITPHKTLQTLKLRIQETVTFLRAVFRDPFSKLSLRKAGSFSEKVEKTGKSAIVLERRRTDHPREGKRRLSWSIVVDNDALDEMKETLGPPGGFGELGFNVAKDGVRFEAMGVGTSFNLCFRLREEGEGRTKAAKKMRRRHT